MATEPKVRPDGRCARKGCTKQRTLTVSKKSGANAAHRKLLERELAADPFHSSDCARAHYGCSLPLTHMQREEAA